MDITLNLYKEREDNCCLFHLSPKFYNNVFLFSEFWLPCLLSCVFKRFNYLFKSTEGVILWIIIGEVHNLSATVPLDFWFKNFRYFKTLLKDANNNKVIFWYKCFACGCCHPCLFSVLAQKKITIMVKSFENW